MPDKRVTLRDVAEATGLSTAAVSYALRGLHVPVETQERVRAAADRLGYQADPIARALASGRTGHVGVLCRSLEDIWQQDLAASLGRAFLGADRQALIVDSTGDQRVEGRLITQLQDQRVDALVVVPVDPAGAHWKAVAEQTVVVSVGDSLPGARCAAEVVFDNARVVRSSLTRFAELGHRRVAILVTREMSTPDRPVDVVAKSVAAEIGLEIELHPTPYDIAGAADVVAGLLGRPDSPTAFFALADSMAYGVYAAARRLGLQVPEDLSVLGSDDNQVSALLTPPLSGYHWPMEQLVDIVVRRTVEAIEAGADRPERMPRTVLSPEPVEGGSVGPVAAGSA